MPSLDTDVEELLCWTRVAIPIDGIYGVNIGCRRDDNAEQVGLPTYDHLDGEGGFTLSH